MDKENQTLIDFLKKSPGNKTAFIRKTSQIALLDNVFLSTGNTLTRVTGEDKVFKIIGTNNPQETYHLSIYLGEIRENIMVEDILNFIYMQERYSNRY